MTLDIIRLSRITLYKMMLSKMKLNRMLLTIITIIIAGRMTLKMILSITT
jgi:hypothetical protein